MAIKKKGIRVRGKTKEMQLLGINQRRILLDSLTMLSWSLQDFMMNHNINSKINIPVMEEVIT